MTALRLQKRRYPLFLQAVRRNVRKTARGFFGDVIGDCPLCGKQVRRNRYGYGCTGYRDGCVLNIPLYLCGKSISVAMAKQLLKEGKTDLISGFVSKKSGKSFDAYLVLQDGKTFFRSRNERNVQTTESTMRHMRRCRTMRPIRFRMRRRRFTDKYNRYK